MKTDCFLNCIVDDNRRKILKTLEKNEKCVCEIIDKLDLEQSLISHHLKKLKGCGLVKSRQDGKNIYYKLSKPEIKTILEKIEKISNEINKKRGIR